MSSLIYEFIVKFFYWIFKFPTRKKLLKLFEFFYIKILKYQNIHN